MVEIRAAEARDAEQDAIDKAQAEYDDAVKKADEDAKKMYAEVQEDGRRPASASSSRGEEVDPAEVQARSDAARHEPAKADIERQSAVKREGLQRERNTELAEIERERDQEIQTDPERLQGSGDVLPPILPLLVGLVVWACRRIREREGVSRSRMRL